MASCHSCGPICAHANANSVGGGTWMRLAPGCLLVGAVHAPNANVSIVRDNEEITTISTFLPRNLIVEM